MTAPAKIRGDPLGTPSGLCEVTLVFKDGIGYDAEARLCCDRFERVAAARQVQSDASGGAIRGRLGKYVR